MDRWNVGILVFDGVEVLDFAGPFEVFSRVRLTPGIESRRSDESAPFHVFTVARSRASILAIGGLEVVPHCSFADAPRIDLLVVPGGFGTRPLLEDREVLDWIRRSAAGSRLVTSVCTGALLLAKAGLLDGRRATTHWRSLAWMRESFPTVTVEEKLHVVEDGHVLTSAGISAGIDMALRVVARYHGDTIACTTARHMEYRYRAEDNGRRV